MDYQARPVLKQEKEDDLAALASAVVEEHCGEGQRVDLNAITRANRISVSFNCYDNCCDGMLEHRAGRFHIYCDLSRAAHRDSPRARFTIAHELGHYFIDEHRQALSAGATPHASICDFNSKTESELEADCFASNLLMPDARFLPRVRGLTTGLEGIVELAKGFDTSVTSTAIRYVKCDPSPCVLVKWSPQGTFLWKYASNSAITMGLRGTICSPDKLPKKCATHLALIAGPGQAPNVIQNGSVASQWFLPITEGSISDVILIEQAFILGRYGVLTLLTTENSLTSH